MAYLIGVGDTKTATIGQTTFWAKNGWIHCQHPVDGHKQMRVKEALERVYALSQMLRNSSEKDLIKYADTRERIQSFVDDMVEICKRAQEQGEYDDESMTRDKVRRLPKSISVPKSFSSGL